MQNRVAKAGFLPLIVFIAILWVIIGALAAFGRLLLTKSGTEWQLAYGMFLILSLLMLGFVVIWLSPKLFSIKKWLIRVRTRIGKLRWLIAIALPVASVYLLGYATPGKWVTDPYLHAWVGLINILVIAFLHGTSKDDLLDFSGGLLAVFSVSLAFLVGAQFYKVSMHPFSLGWSEGNRMWDFSVLFGQRLYDFPAGEKIFSYTDIGRQLIGGIPFLFDGVTIAFQRFWTGITYTLLYMLFGWALFWRTGERKWALFFMGLVSYLFLIQGPIHPPLIVCATLVALSWRRSLWVAVPLIVLAAFFAQASRFTWMFAPAMWIGILELNNEANKVSRATWVRALSLVFAGLFGGLALPYLVGWVKALSTPEMVLQGITFSLSHDLLWYRLLPSATSGSGVLLRAFVAIAPLALLAGYWFTRKIWRITTWQALAIGLGLFLFFVVGVIVSTKIGGGGDLHNLDMFLIGLLFTAAIAWRNGGKAWFQKAQPFPLWVQVTILALVLIPGLRPILHISPIQGLKSDRDVQASLQIIRQEVAQAQQNGQVLFMDQRQLLTFGYVQAPLIDDYEKKFVMDQAMAHNAEFFAEFYQDLANKRFSLIVTEKLHFGKQGSEFFFGEENDAWVKWVSIPVMCFYQPTTGSAITEELYHIALLVPREDVSGCAGYLR